MSLMADSYSDLARTNWLNEALESGYKHFTADRWSCAEAGAKVRSLPKSYKVLFASWGVGTDVLLATSGAIVLCTTYHGSVSFTVMAKDRRRAEATITRFRKLFPEDEASPEKPRVQVSFWNMGQRGPESSSRWIDVQPWDHSAGNYPADTRRSLDELMASHRPVEGSGKLILWNGEPGTGKTSAIRSLAWEWRDWADLQYISDPERFLGAESEYLLGMLSAAQREKDESRWFVVVLEDTGEMLAPDARQRVGQALSRLLNVGDGLLGQGIRLLTLITTNEPLDHIHPAVGRPGRCFARVTFERFPATEARAWLSVKAQPEVVKRLAGRSASLAQLFALASNREWSEAVSERPVGFTAVGFTAS